MARESVDSQVDASALLEPAPDADEALKKLPSHALPFDQGACDEQREHETVALLAELRHWWWAGLISDGEYRAKEEEILRLSRA